MIFDKETMFADGMAFGGTPTPVDLGTVRPGPGRQIRVEISAASDAAGITGITVLDGAATANEALLTVPFTAAEINAGPVSFSLPAKTQRFVTIALTGATAGTYTAGLVLDSSQTNFVDQS